MTTIVAVRKNNTAVIGADTLISYGDQLESAWLIRNHSKLIKVGDSWLGVTGHAAIDLVLRGIFQRADSDEEDGLNIDFSNVGGIFSTFIGIHQRMKSDFFMKTDEDKEDEFESMHMNTLVANPHGIFGVCSKRSVFEYNSFYAYGSGDQYALGAMHALYDKLDSAEEIARTGLMAAASFDNGTGEPFELHSIQLNNP